MAKYTNQNDFKIINWKNLVKNLGKQLDKLAKAAITGILSIIAFEVLLAIVDYVSRVN